MDRKSERNKCLRTGMIASGGLATSGGGTSSGFGTSRRVCKYSHTHTNTHIHIHIHMTFPSQAAPMSRRKQAHDTFQYSVFMRDIELVQRDHKHQHTYMRLQVTKHTYTRACASRAHGTSLRHKTAVEGQTHQQLLTEFSDLGLSLSLYTQHNKPSTPG